MYGQFSLISRLISPALSCSYPGANERNNTGTGTWGVRVHQDSSRLPSLSMLSDDILVDHIFDYLMVEDILCLRAVNKLFYNLTHHGIIWKRFLQRIGPNGPVLPPSTRYSPNFLTSFEAERLVIRAITVHKSWILPNPFAATYLPVQAHRHILSMVVLPGGKYLVASACNLAKTHYSLVVYVLDHRISGIVPLAETPVRGKAYNVCAKYMNVEGIPSILIGYIRRKISKSHQSANSIDPSIYNPYLNNPRFQIDAPMPLEYVATCLQISLDALDALGNPLLVPGSQEFFDFAASQPPPFRFLGHLRSDSELRNVDLGEVDGVPNMVVAKMPETIVMKELTSDGFISTFKCARETILSQQEQPICNFRLLPLQGQILVVRSTNRPQLAPANPPPGAPPIIPDVMFTVAMFPTPDPGDGEAGEFNPLAIASFYGKDIEDFQISDPHVLNDHGGDTDRNFVPPPINIFYRNDSGGRICHMIISPTPRESAPEAFKSTGKPHYAIANLKSNMMHRLSFKNNLNDDSKTICRTFVIPGCLRSLFYSIPRDTRSDTLSVRNFTGHLLSKRGDDAYSIMRRETLYNVLRNVPKHRENTLGQFDLPSYVLDHLRDGVTAIAWDEGTGRIFYSKPHDTMLHMLDMAQTPLEAMDGQRYPIPLEDERMLDL
ncbi:hypothetical protein DEU56DRAFT_321757 [Suillus clintonianus]|uniref:uncharacterized protein n=1 Tax=Suillus clintonianus TaxID=1904413 RepID=UPI001B880D1D|nr:uncharacterized protein DEU56DRAFT_321757 [Suillus clintonianus]KAG2155735.1 hypothetical protein DEU56DRAFT_321757 [Suillus clintonianus]